MNNVSGINSQTILEQLNQKESKETNSGESDFLKLLVAQLNNQNPLSPQENGEFLAQLAQFSTVEGVEKLNLTMEQFSSGMLSNQALQATALVGRSVQIPSDVGQLNVGASLTGSVDLPASTANLVVNVFDQTGALVRQIPMGSHPAGKVNFSWDGFDSNGVPMPSGHYRIVADADISDGSEQVVALVNANVDSVTTGQSGAVILNLEGSLGSIALSEISQIN